MFFYTFKEVKNKYLLHNSNFLNYYRIIESIPYDWKQILKSNTERNNNEELSLLKQIKNLKSTNKLFTRLKWEDEVGEISWKHVNLIPFRCLIDTKLRAFQV